MKLKKLHMYQYHTLEIFIMLDSEVEEKLNVLHKRIVSIW